ncbi:GNAT family N-acetyltransferase [Quadrisphaera oryzae]|uniref:GNAT family N-acetyltransferase n=1 Tax=Quadrisphaera TaxID=317661 RepID=UPI00164407D5|nr:GNAT family protein [Quadrisphaera sp. RL12-1S]MBC3762958.1 GNAT family N-acetyltransferase [Quadrisphaera sp. RL12-1S]
MAEAPVVTLRARTPADLDVLYGIASDLDTWEERDPSAPGPVPRQRYDAQATAAATSYRDDVFFVVDVDGEPVGSATLFGFDALARHAEAGISLAAGHRGRGVGTEALRQLVEFGFTRRNLRRIHLQAIASNTGALRAYAKVGFVEEGRRREHAWVRGAYEDVVVMGLLRADR